MRLKPGQRLSSGQRSSFQVEERCLLTPRHVFYRAKKVTWNARDEEPVDREAASDELLGVLLRAPVLLEFLNAAPVSKAEPTELGDDGEVALHCSVPSLGAVSNIRPSLETEFELKQVLDQREAPWFLEPLDRIDMVVHSVSGDATVPLLVVSDPHGEPLSSLDENTPLPQVLRLCREVLLMLELLHRAELVAGGVEAAHILVHPSGRWWLLSTDCVARSSEAAQREADLASWGEFCLPFVARACPPADRSLLSAPAEAGRLRFESPFWAALARAKLGPAPDLDPAGAADCRWLLDRLKRIANRPASGSELVRAPSRLERHLISLRMAIRPLAARLWKPGAGR
jgi:hypothetical protein